MNYNSRESLSKTLRTAYPSISKTTSILQIDDNEPNTYVPDRLYVQKIVVDKKGPRRSKRPRERTQIFIFRSAKIALTAEPKTVGGALSSDDAENRETAIEEEINYLEHRKKGRSYIHLVFVN